MALAEMKYPPAQPSQKLPLEDRNFMLRIRSNDDGSSYWFGYADGDDYLPQPPSTELVRVEGEYEVAERTRAISDKIKVLGHVPLKLQ